MRISKTLLCVAVFVSLMSVGNAKAATPRSQELKESIEVIYQFYLGGRSLGGLDSHAPAAYRIRTLRGSQPGEIVFFADGSRSDYRHLRDGGTRRRFAIRQAVMAVNPPLAVKITGEN